MKPALMKHSLTLLVAVLLSPLAALNAADTPSRTRLSVPEMPELESFFGRMIDQVKGDSHTIWLDGTTVRVNPYWIRDDIHELKGYKYWEKDLSSALEFLCEHQTDSGFFYEMFTSLNDMHTGYVDPGCILRFPKDHQALVRLELEADIEYLMVEGCYQVWQATGDDKWLRKVLPHLTKGIEYSMNDPKRWDATHMLVKRTFTIDTWDFTWGVPANGPYGNRRIESNLPMAIMHGDNTGMIQACRQLALLYEHLGDTNTSGYWTQKAVFLQRNLFATCWNGKFFTHQVHLGGNPLSAGETSEEKRLSLSNAYALNRGVLDLAQGRSILDEYQARRKQHGQELFSEWYSIDPPYADFPNLSNPTPAGTYINGGLAGFVGGELAKGAFNYGEEAYGWDILQRAMRQVKKDGSIYFLYKADGSDQGGGPSGWSAAAFISAIVEGLAGLEDKGALWQHVRVSPRWAVTGLTQASITADYGPSGAYLGYDWKLKEDRITLQLHASGVEDADFHLLLPTNTSLREVRVDGNPVKAIENKVASSNYADFNIQGKVAGSGPLIEVIFLGK